MNVVTIHFGDLPLDAMRVDCIHRVHDLAVAGGHVHHVCSDKGSVAGLPATMSLEELENDIVMHPDANIIWQAAKKAPFSFSRSQEFAPIAMSDVARVWLAGKWPDTAYFDTDVLPVALDIPCPETKPYFAQMNHSFVDIDVVLTNNRQDWFRRWGMFRRHISAFESGNGFIWPLLNNRNRLPGISWPGVPHHASMDIGVISHSWYTHKGSNFS